VSFNISIRFLTISQLLYLIAANTAATSQEVAENSFRIASATQNDTQSMKTLAIMTMIFMPGAFVSSLLSTPVFRWNSEEKPKITVQVPGLLIYLGITLFLLVTAFLVWYICVVRKSLRKLKVQDLSGQHARQTSGVSEVRALALKRAFSVSGSGA
jgi:hypothetical protein